jgi:hypothetical protein
MKNKLLYLTPVVSLVGIATSNQQAIAQQPQTKNIYSGNLQFGLRGTLNPFLKNAASWISYGAQLRIKISRRVNTEWFADYFPATIKWAAERRDIRMGSAIQYYPLHEIYTGKECTPYFSIGPTSTYTQINSRTFNAESWEAKRWSFGVIAGMGMLLNVSRKFTFGFVSQYCAQVATEFKFRKSTISSVSDSQTTLPDNKISYEGQLLFCMSVNYTLGDLW